MLPIGGVSHWGLTAAQRRWLDKQRRRTGRPLDDRPDLVEVQQLAELHARRVERFNRAFARSLANGEHDRLYQPATPPVPVSWLGQLLRWVRPQGR